MQPAQVPNDIQYMTAFKPEQ